MRFPKKKLFIKELALTIGGSAIFVGMVNYSFFGYGLFYTLGWWIVGIAFIAIGVTE